MKLTKRQFHYKFMLSSSKSRKLPLNIIKFIVSDRLSLTHIITFRAYIIRSQLDKTKLHIVPVILSYNFKVIDLNVLDLKFFKIASVSADIKLAIFISFVSWRVFRTQKLF